MRAVNHLGHTLIPSLLGNGIALDCGSNYGDFARWLHEHSQLRVYSFEPDPRLFATLPQIENVEFLPMAVNGTSGTLELGLGENVCSSVVYREREGQSSVTVPSISVDDFCTQRGIEDIDFIKMDIEGAELSVLECMSDRLLRNTRQLTVEFHDFLDPNDLPRIHAVVQRLQSLDFYFLRVSKHTWGDCLFLNRKWIPVSTLQHWNMLVFAKYVPGFKRMLAKMVRKSNGQ